MVFQITDNSTTRCQHVQTDNKETANIPLHCLFMRGIQEWMVDSPHKGSIKRKGLSYHDGIIYIEMTIVQHIIE